MDKIKYTKKFLGFAFTRVGVAYLFSFMDYAIFVKMDKFYMLFNRFSFEL